jgi:hypothetical protein
LKAKSTTNFNMADEVAAKKSRVTKDVGEAFTVFLLLAWNDIVVDGHKTSVLHIEAVGSGRDNS